jgi:hypothetical protein
MIAIRRRNSRRASVSKGFLLVVVVFLTVVPGRAVPADFRVWVANDSVRIDPRGGRAYEDNPFLFPDALTGDYQSSSLIWNGVRRTVTLKAARNETVSFQIIVDRLTDKPVSHARVQIGDLVGPNGSRISRAQIELFKEWYVEVKRPSSMEYTLGAGWYPDALLPCDRWQGNLYPSSYVMPFDIPDQLNNLGEQQRNQALWVDLYVPKERDKVPAGSYRSKIVITADSGTFELDIELEVWDFALPEETHLAGNIHTDTEINDLPEDLELKYFQLIRRHRLAMGVLGYAPELEVKGTDVSINWTSYDQRLGKYLDGRAFTEEYGYHGPGYGIPIEHLVLPFDSHPMNVYKVRRGIQIAGKEFKFYRAWPVDRPEQGITAEYETVFKKAFQAFQQHFDANPRWNRTRLIVFFLGLDEAYDETSWEQMVYYARLLDASGAKRLEFRIDGLYPMEAMERLSQYVDIAILAPGNWDLARIKEMRKKGIEDWFYTSPGVVDGDLLGCRAMSWVCWKYGISSWTVWELDYNALRAYLFPETYVTGDRIYNLHGMLVYRGETMGLKQPVASIRLKQLRRGAQDYEYFWLAARDPKGRAMVDQAVGGVINDPLRSEQSWGLPAMWNHNSEAWEKVRIRVGEALNSSGK